MSSNNSNPSPGGIGFAGALTLLFIGLKLGHVIRWSWWWILAPLWVSAALVVVIVAVLALVAFISVSVEERRSSR